MKLTILIMCFSTLLVICSGQYKRPKINVKLDDRLQLVEYANGQIKLVLKDQPSLTGKPQTDLVSKTKQPVEEMISESQPEPEHLSISSLESQILPDRKLLPQTDLQSIPNLDTTSTGDTEPALDINPMAITASVVNPALPPFLTIIRNLLKLVCDGLNNNQQLKKIHILGFNKFCNQRDWTESIITKQLNQILYFIQSHLPKFGLSI